MGALRGEVYSFAKRRKECTRPRCAVCDTNCEPRRRQGRQEQQGLGSRFGVLGTGRKCTRRGCAVCDNPQITQMDAGEGWRLVLRNMPMPAGCPRPPASRQTHPTHHQRISAKGEANQRCQNRGRHRQDQPDTTRHQARKGPAAQTDRCVCGGRHGGSRARPAGRS